MLRMLEGLKTLCVVAIFGGRFQVFLSEYVILNIWTLKIFAELTPRADNVGVKSMRGSWLACRLHIQGTRGSR